MHWTCLSALSLEDPCQKWLFVWLLFHVDEQTVFLHYMAPARNGKVSYNQVAFFERSNIPFEMVSRHEDLCQILPKHTPGETTCFSSNNPRIDVCSILICQFPIALRRLDMELIHHLLSF